MWLPAGWLCDWGLCTWTLTWLFFRPGIYVHLLYTVHVTNQNPELPLTGSSWFFSPLVKRTLTLTKRNYVGFETSGYVYIQNLLVALFWSPTDVIICLFELVETIKVLNILRICMKIFLYFAKYMHIQYHQTALSPVTCELVHLDWSEPELNEGGRDQICCGQGLFHDP